MFSHGALLPLIMPQRRPLPDRFHAQWHRRSKSNRGQLSSFSRLRGSAQNSPSVGTGGSLDLCAETEDGAGWSSKASKEAGLAGGLPAGQIACLTVQEGITARAKTFRKLALLRAKQGAAMLHACCMQALTTPCNCLDSLGLPYDTVQHEKGANCARIALLSY
jgi:hypothetical protein